MAICIQPVLHDALIFTFYSDPGRWAEYCDEHVCLSVCLSAHISGTTCRNFTKFSIHVASVLLWWHVNILCIPILWMVSCCAYTDPMGWHDLQQELWLTLCCVMLVESNLNGFSLYECFHLYSFQPVNCVVMGKMKSLQTTIREHSHWALIRFMWHCWVPRQDI